MVAGSSELSTDAFAVIADGHNEKLLSVASLWEITIEANLGKLPFGQPLTDFFDRIEQARVIQRLSISPEHLITLGKLPLHHKNPFDRLIVAQALSEDCTLVSRDRKLDAYGVSRLW